MGDTIQRRHNKDGSVTVITTHRYKDESGNNVSDTYTERYFPTKSKNMIIAFVLCLFLGYFGVHWFYLGKKSKGFLYLFTFGLFGIGWLVDCVRLLLTIVVNKG